MSKFNALTLTTMGVLAVGAVAGAAITPFAVPQRHLLPVEQFPLTIGSWKTVGEHPVEQTVQDRLPTARIVDRIYEDARSGNQVDVMLLTATAVEDIHKPTSCLPAQGWQLDSPEYRTIGGQPLTILRAGNGASQRIDVAYWLTGYYPAPSSHVPIIDRVLDMRNRIVGRDKAMSLFVRVIANEAGDNTAMMDFVREAIPTINSLTSSYKAPGISDPVLRML